MTDSEDDIRFRDIAPAIEFVCWVVLGLCPLLRLVNGAAVTTDQFVIQVALFSLAFVSALGLRIFNFAHPDSFDCKEVSWRRPVRMSIRLRASFAAVYAMLERPHVARRAVAVLLVMHTLLLGYSAYVHSPTLDEPAHLAAGLSYWKFDRFDLYRVNPPLVKMIAALPVVVSGYRCH